MKVESVRDHLFHVTADVRNIRQPRLDLSLPTWTPGWYTVENYAKNILRFHVTDARGRRLPHAMTRKQTWRVQTAGLDRIKIEFDYSANVLGLNQAKITNDWAFFTGIQLFLLAEGHRASPATVRFDVPDNWRIISALKETRNAKVFHRAGLRHARRWPTEMVNFDVMTFDVKASRLFRLHSGGSVPQRSKRAARDMLTASRSCSATSSASCPMRSMSISISSRDAESNAGGGLSI